MTSTRDLSMAMACLYFDVALAGYRADRGDPEELLKLLKAAGLALGSTVPLDPEIAKIVVHLTGTACEDYDDAARAVRHWFAMTEEDGARH